MPEHAEQRRMRVGFGCHAAWTYDPHMNGSTPTAAIGEAVPTADACVIPTRVMPLAPLTPELQAMVDKGVDPVWVAALGHAPDVLLAWTNFYWPLLFAGAVEVRTKEAARLRIAQLNACHY